MKILQWISAMAVIASVAGCAAPPAPQYYTLLPSTGPAGSPTAAFTAHSSKATYAISVQPVQLPEQVDRPQIVISSQHNGGTQVMPLNDSLWASPLSDQVRRALADDLSRQLKAIDISMQSAPASLSLWKIYLAVQRFESVYNQRVVLEATWRLVPVSLTGKKGKICRAEVREPVQSGIPALITGHQRALHELAIVIAAQLSGKNLDRDSPNVLMKGCA
jgi:uncharacterized lipoprotein YmbA